MKTLLRGMRGCVVGLGLCLAVAAPAVAQSGGKAAIIVERIEAQITYQSLVLQATKNELIAYGVAVRDNNP